MRSPTLPTGSRGETPDLGQLEKLDADRAKTLHRLLPAIQLLSELADEEATEDHAPWFTRPPELLGDFRLGREIGRGGIGVVYEATQVSLGRRVAVKVLPPSSLLDSRQLRRFEIEAQAGGRAPASPHRPRVRLRHRVRRALLRHEVDRGAEPGRGRPDLRDETWAGSPPREVAELGRQAAEALDYAHRHEVLHRDIKPSNFLIDAVHRLWIADFGLARVRGDSDLTASGDVLGTLRYLSPEQAKGSRAAVDGRSDLYAPGSDPL